MNCRIATTISVLRSNEEHNFFISGVSKAIKDVQYLAAISSGVCVSNSDWQLQKLSERLDHLFLHGLKNYVKGYFEAFREFTHQSISEEIFHIKNITTDIGRSRAWLLHALRDHLLGSYLQCTLEKSKHFAKFYDRPSIFFDSQRLELLITLISGLENIEFNLSLDVDYLDLSCFKGIPINSTPNFANESQNVSAINNSTDDNSVAQSTTTTTTTTVCASIDHNLSNVENIPHDEVIVVEHLLKKKKKNIKNKDRDDSSISSDSSSTMTADAPNKISTMNGDAFHSNVANENIANSDVKPFKKSEESSHFDELFEKIVFGKTSNQTNDEMADMKGETSSSQNEVPHEYSVPDNDIRDQPRDEQNNLCNDREVSIDESIEASQQASPSFEEESIQEEALDEIEIPNTSDDCSEAEVSSELVIHDDDDDKQSDSNRSDTESDLNYENPDRGNETGSSESPSEPKTEVIFKAEKAENSLQFKVSNNLKLVLFLDVFKSDEEQLLKAFQTFQNFMEGKPTPLLVLISSQSVYFLVPFDKKLKLHGYIPYKDLNFLSVGLDEQSLDFVAKNKARYSVSTCNPSLTRTLVDEVSRAVCDSLIDGNILTLYDATNQKIAIKRWIGSLYPNLKTNGAAIKGFFLVSYLLNIPLHKGYENKKIIRKGSLDVLTHVRHMHGIEPMWKRSYFVLRRESLHEFQDDSLKTEISTFQLSEWHNCKKCSKSQSGKKHCFSIVPSSHHESNRTISFTEQKTKSPLVRLFKTVSSQFSSLTSDTHHRKVLPTLTFSARTDDDANEWITDLNSIIRNSHRKVGSKKIKHGCCILIGDAIHLCSMNSLSCTIHSRASFPLKELRSMTQSNNSINLTFNTNDDLNDDDENLKAKEGGVNSDALNMDFELVEFNDVEDDDSRIKSIREHAAPGEVENSQKPSTRKDVSTLDVFFQSAHDRDRFSSIIKSLFSKLTMKELQISRIDDDDNDLLPPELDQLYNFYDWNSLDSVTNIP